MPGLLAIIGDLAAGHDLSWLGLKNAGYQLGNNVKNRFFRYSCSSYESLNRNAKHSFAQNYALSIYKSDAVYSFIPKNGCSTLRTSLAYSNGCIKDTSDFNWIHLNNQTFKASLKELVTAEYTFVILRCPFARLASVYLDKIVSRDPNAWLFCDLLSRKVEPEDITFEYFVKALKKQSVLRGNIHWRPQIDFLVYDEYDDYFCLEQFSHATDSLEQKISLKVIDARPLTKHGTDKYALQDDQCYSSASPLEIDAMQRNGICPSHKSLYTDELHRIVAKLYADDLKLYSDIFGESGLMFAGG